MSKRYKYIFLFLGLIISLSAQDSVPLEQQFFIKNTNPIFVTLGAGKIDKSPRQKWSTLVRNDILLELNVVWRSLAEDSSSTGSLGSWFRLYFKIPSLDNWAIIAPGGKLITSGKEVPSPQNLADALSGSGFRSPKNVYLEFLLKYPDHVEARSKLIDSLRFQALGRSQRSLPMAARELLAQGKMDEAFQLDWSDSEDRRIWGEVELQMEFAYKFDHWKKMPPLNAGRYSVENIKAEAKSRLMKSMYRKHIGRVEIALQEIPSSPVLWSHWMHMAEVLGDIDIIKTIEKLDFLPGEPGIPFQYIEPIVKSGKSSNNWKSISKILKGPWSRVIKPWSDLPPGISKKKLELSWISNWNNFGKPLLEAYLRVSDDINADNLVKSLSSHPEAAPQILESCAMAQALRRVDLAHSWRMISADVPNRPKIRLLERARPLAIFQITKNSYGNFRKSNLKESLEKSDINVFVIDKVITPKSSKLGKSLNAESLEIASQYREYFGWQDFVDQWAVLSHDNQILNQGVGIPDIAEIQNPCSKAGYGTTLDILKTFNKEHPNQLEALARIAEILRDNASKRMPLDVGLDRDEKASALVRELTPDQDQEIWGEYSKALGALIDTPIWTERGSRLSGYSFWPIDSRSCRSPLLKSVARKWIPELEAALVSSPTNERLWTGWQAMTAVESNEKSLLALIDRLTLLPFDEQHLPPYWVINFQVEALQKRHDWAEIEKICSALWDRARSLSFDSMTQRSNTYNSKMWNAIGSPLTTALLRLKKETVAESFLQEWIGLGGKIDNPDSIRRVSKEMQANKILEILK